MTTEPTSAEAAHDELRALLFSIAYRMLGTVSDAEDVVQDAFLRLERARHDGTRVASPRAFLTTVATRLAIDELRSARVRRETYFGPWLPEPLITAIEPDPGQAVELADSLSLSFLVLLEALSPVQRAVFLLREVFDYPYDEIAKIVDKSETNCRQICARARTRVTQGKPRFHADREHQHELARRFLAAFENGELDRLIEFLTADVGFYGDGGGKGRGLPQPVYGRDRVARLLCAFASQFRDLDAQIRPAVINGQPGTLNLDADGQLINVFEFEVIDGCIQTIRSIINPDKLTHLGYPLSDVGRSHTRDLTHRQRSIDDRRGRRLPL
jgi:RNA polymerase sigma-70 factor (TIGR02957 family)